MKLYAEIDSTEFELEIGADGDNLNVLINGEWFAAEVSQPEPNIFLIKHDGSVIEALVLDRSDREGRRTVWVKGREYQVRLKDPKRLRGSARGTQQIHGEAEIRSAMPGKVVRVLREVGSAVERGEGVLVVEAMKMQNELKAPIAGSVKTVRVSAGDTVAAGDLLATIE
jgi:biotin carboxyl carrier protein